MSDSPDTPDSGPPRDTVTGRYIRRHAAPEDPPEDTPPPPPPAAATGTTPPPAPSASPAESAPDDQEGRKRWMLLLLLLLILLVLLCLGFSYLTWWRKDKPAAQPTPAPTVTAVSPTPAQSPPPSASPSPTPSKRTVNMPDVVGMPAADAKVILEGAGFTSIRFVTEANPGADLGVLISYTVTQQSVTAGTQVPVDTAIVITCKTTSNGKG